MKKFNDITEEFNQLGEVITTKELASLVGSSSYFIRKLTRQGILKKLDSSSSKKFFFNKKSAIEVIYLRETAYERYMKFFMELFYKAYSTDSIQTIFAVLEVDGISKGHWNPTEEIFRFIDDFNDMLKHAYKNHRFPLRKYRLAITMYCHLLEMSFPQKLLMNLLRIIKGEDYTIDPFSHSSIKPPSLKWKIKELIKESESVDTHDLPKFISEFYNDEIRNSFYHSDYCLTENDFRYRTKIELKNLSSKKADLVISELTDISINDLSVLITKCFAFLEALLHSHTNIKRQLASIKKFHKLSQYEVLELLSKDDLLYGFNKHFSNGAKATFKREAESVEANNIHFEKDGSVNFMIGNKSKLSKNWKVNGKIFEG